MAALKLDAGGVAVLAGVGLLLYLIAKGRDLTATATNAAGERVTAYEGRGVLGTVGAAANAASGGILASVGQWIGSTAYDLINPPQAEPAPPAAPTLTTGDLSRADRMADAWAINAASGQAAFGIYPKP